MDTSEIRINERGDETHESWLLLRANRVQSYPGTRLFDSEIPHQHLITVTVTRCYRKRDLHHDHHYNGQTLMEFELSQAQWGAFVSSFGQGTGVPATLRRLHGVGDVSPVPVESRLEESHREVREAATESLDEIITAYDEVTAAFEAGGKRRLREALRDLGIRLQNAPKNMEFAAKSLTEHAENVVTKARADIEAIALVATQQGALAESSLPQLGEGEAATSQEEAR